MTVSVISVNAATDGAVTKAINSVVEKITISINGEETTRDATITQNSDGSIEYEISVDENTDKSAEFSMTDEVPPEAE